MTRKLGKIWTDSVAYVMLLAGAGLSIVFNVVNTLAVRGAAVNWVDWVIAIAAPSLVVGMVELFVNARWQGQPWHMQWLRWTGCLAIGASAARTSWTHGHALLLAHGQTADVAFAFPLAIDMLAVMATALILSGRTSAPAVSLPSTKEMQDAMDDDLADKMITGHGTGRPMGILNVPGVRAVEDELPGPITPWTAPAPEDVRKAVQDMSDVLVTRPDAPQDVLGEFASDLDTILADILDAGDGKSASATVRRTRVPSVQGVPDDVRELIVSWATASGRPGEDLPDRKDVAELIAGHKGVTVRSARRWMATVLDKG